MTLRRGVTLMLTLVLLVAAMRAPLTAQRADDLSAATDRYESANYEEALAILDRLDTGERSSDERQVIQHYRALCLIALDRVADAERPAEAMIRAKPMAPLDGDLPPRLRELLVKVRPRVAREMVKEYYERGRDLYQRRDFAAARQELSVAIALIDDKSVGLNADPAFADMRLIADGFLKLATETSSTASAVGAPADATDAPTPDAGGTRPAAPPVSQAPPASPAAAADSTGPPQTPTFGIIPPRAIQQAVPPLPRWIGSGPGREGEIQLEVAADGSILSAKVTVPLNPAYDPLLLATALKDWRYEPALRNGVPVPYTLKVRVVLPPH